MKQDNTVFAIGEAEEEIRRIVKEAYLYHPPKKKVERQIEAVIARAARNTENARLKEDIRRGLLNFANRQRTLWSSLPIGASLLCTIASGAAGKNVSRAVVGGTGVDYYETQKGVAMQSYYEQVWEKVKPILDRICGENALDPSDMRGRNSLRNLAEMEARYQAHQDSIEALRSAGEKLVIASSHADCSERCKKWQGRVYSLDGSAGRTKDGRRYVPLETATDVFYTTKAGRRYKNGLLGFNCRHYLIPFREGMGIPSVREEDRKREYAITQTQREMERKIRAYRAEATVYKGISDKISRAARGKASALYEKYKAFCIANRRAFYPKRTKF